MAYVLHGFQEFEKMVSRDGGTATVEGDVLVATFPRSIPGHHLTQNARVSRFPSVIRLLVPPYEDKGHYRDMRFEMRRSR